MFTDQVHHFIEQHGLLKGVGPVLVGISGGVDSITLLNVLLHLGYAVSVAHVNYQLRAKAAEDDEALVRSLCQSADVPFHSLHRDAHAYAEEHGQSIQEAARAIRYAYFQRLASEEGISRVAVAHHLDDQAETVLMNLLRGTGPVGLAGMPASRELEENSRVQLVRPLLGCLRRDIEAYAKAEGLTWREDASNANSSYRRNAIRAEIMPIITAHFGESAVRNIARSADLLRGYVEDTFQQELAQHFAAVAQEKPSGGQLNLAALQVLPEVWRGRVVLEANKRWLPSAPRTQAFTEEVKGLLKAQVGRRVALESGTIWRERHHLRWVQKQEGEEEGGDCYFLQPGIVLVLPEGMMQLEMMEEHPGSLHCETPDTILVNADMLKMPLLVRLWKAGDRLQPFGMAGTKKVSDILTDAQVSAHQRARVWVVCSGEEIIWVVGVRMAEGMRVRPETDRIAEITFKPHLLETV